MLYAEFPGEDQDPGFVYGISAFATSPAGEIVLNVRYGSWFQPLEDCQYGLAHAPLDDQTPPSAWPAVTGRPSWTCVVRPAAASSPRPLPRPTLRRTDRH